MEKSKFSPTVLGFAIGWLFASIVLTPPLETYEGWVVMALLVIAFILVCADR